MKMNEELERIENAIRYGDKLDVYDINVLLKIIKTQQEEIEKFKKENYDLKGAFQRIMKKHNHLKTK
jgi:hypothetical protein